MKSIVKSAGLQARAALSIPGGVNSPARAFLAVGGYPLFADHAYGCKLWDADGNEYIDYIGSWGPLIAGHSHPEVIEAINKTSARGTSFGMSTELEILLAEKIKSDMPSIDLVRMVNSGTEAAMSALRLARGYTGCSKVIKFEGCYHGHGDSFLVAAGSGALTHGVPSSAGITPGTAGDTLVARFNDPESVKEQVNRFHGEIAALIVEPVVGNMGTVPPEPGFLEFLRDITSSEGIILIFDEVMTGFRLSIGGAQELYSIKPDLTVLGKIIGGGLPVGAYGGKAEIMECLSPVGPVYQAGTLSGNPLAMSAGLATLNIASRAEMRTSLDDSSGKLAEGIAQAIKNESIPAIINSVGSMFTIFFTDVRVRDHGTAMTCNRNMFSLFFRGMLERGILLPPSQFEAAFVSAVHDYRAIQKTIDTAAEVFREIRSGN